MLVVITEWHEFRGLDPRRIKEVMRQPRIVDLRNIFDPEEMRGLGFAYEASAGPSRATDISRIRSHCMSQTAHKFDPTILREYDIRGIVGDTVHASRCAAPSAAPSARMVRRARAASAWRWAMTAG